MSNNNHSNKLKRKTPQKLDAETGKLFGKHVSKEKARLLLAATLLACATPMILGARMWNAIPEIVPSGIIGSNGQDDSIPRWMVAFGLSGLMCLLNLLSHFQLANHQKRMLMPPAHVRLMGRWGFPVISVFFCSGMIRQALEIHVMPLTFVAPAALGLMLMLLGTHAFDCPRDSRVALRFSFTERSEEAWKDVHRFAGRCWLAAGLLVIAGAMLGESASLILSLLVPVSLAAPLVYGKRNASRGS